MAISPTPIGLNLPIKNGKISGYFDQTFDTFSQYRANIINLIRTKPGERRMNPTFGCRLWNVVFEQNDDVIQDKIRRIIKEDISKWIPGVSVSTVQVKVFEDDQSVDLRDIYKLYIVATFTITAINQQDSVEIILDTGKI